MNKHDKGYTKKQGTTPLQLDFTIRNYFPPDISQDNGIPEQLPLSKDNDLEKATDKLLLTHYVPASVLVNKDMEILRFRGSTSRYLEPSSGKASLHLLKMIKEELAFELRTVIHKAKKEGRIVRKEGVVVGV